MKKIIATTIIATLATGSVMGQGIINNNYGTVVSVDNAKQLESYVDSIKKEVNANTQDIMMVNNDSVIRDFRLQDQINELKKQGDTTEIRNDLNAVNEKVYNQGVQIENNKMNIQAQQTQLKNLKAQHQADMDRVNSKLANMESDFQDFKGETRKGIAGAIAIAGLERPNYSDDHKLGVMVGTGTYKGHTAVAYGITYQPNWNTVIAVKGTDDAVTTSIGFAL